MGDTALKPTLLTMVLVLTCILPLFQYAHTAKSDSDMLFYDSFDDGVADDWTEYCEASGYWNVVDEEYYVTVELNGISTVDSLNLTDCVIETKLRFADTEVGFKAGIVFRYIDNGKHYSFELSNEYDQIQILKYTPQNPGYGEPISTSLPYPISVNVSYALRIEMHGETFTGYLNDQQIVTGKDDDYKTGKVGLRARRADVFFDDFKVLSSPFRTIVVPDDFPTIQEAINNANEGDTVFVKNGTYYENVVVNKVLSLVGENNENTIIDGRWIPTTIVDIISSNVVFKQFKVRNAPYSVRGIAASGMDVQVEDNIVVNASSGIAILSNCTVRNNLVVGTDYVSSHGIWIHGLNNVVVGNSVVNHTASDAGQGICLGPSDIANNLIAENCIQNNTIGFWLEGVSSSNVYHNNIVGNGHQVEGYGAHTLTWDDGYLSGGNYWSDYFDIDNNSDGIGDTPYVIDAYNQDNYPLVHPYGSIRNTNTTLAYLTIQSAINAPETLGEHTILVKSGIYNESISFPENAHLTLVGEDKFDTAINGPIETYYGMSLIRGFQVSGATRLRYSQTTLCDNILLSGISCGLGSRTTVADNFITGGIALDSSKSFQTSSHIINNTLFGAGIIAEDSYLQVDATKNMIFDADIGISVKLYQSSCNIVGNIISNCHIGVNLYPASFGTAFVSENFLADNDYGVYVTGAQGSLRPSHTSCFHNNLINNTVQVFLTDPNALVTWDDSYPSGGNYWSDYDGSDSDGNGLGGSPYVINENNADNFPLMAPWEPPDFSVGNLAPSKTIVGQGCSATVNLTMLNHGNKIEGSNVTVYANETAIHSEYVMLRGGNTATLSLLWNTSGFALGNYALKAVIDPILGETETENNMLAYESVRVVIPGDVNADGYVGIDDLHALGEHFSSEPGCPNWDPIYDLVEDNYVGIDDIFLAAKHFGEEE